MSKSIYDIDTEVLLNLIASSEGNLALATERLNSQLEQPYGTISEYDIKARISQLDIQSTDVLATRFRALLAIRLFDLIITTTDTMKAVICDLRPAELARTHASLVNSFSTLTAPSTKVTFDFTKELDELSREFPDIPVEEMKLAMKEMELKVKGK